MLLQVQKDYSKVLCSCVGQPYYCLHKAKAFRIQEGELFYDCDETLKKLLQEPQ